MSRKMLIMIGMVVGSSVGGYVPTLFGVNAISYGALLCSTLGAFLGVYIAFKLTA